jgi:hypothetical protein
MVWGNSVWPGLVWLVMTWLDADRHRMALRRVTQRCGVQHRVEWFGFDSHKHRLNNVYFVDIRFLLDTQINTAHSLCKNEFRPTFHRISYSNL